MDKLIESDLYRYCGYTGLRAFMVGLTIPGFRYMFFLRKSSLSKKYTVSGIFYRLFLRRYMFKYGFQIPASTQIGKGF